MDASGNLQMDDEDDDALFFEGDDAIEAAAPPPPPAAKAPARRKAKRVAPATVEDAPTEPMPLPAPAPIAATEPEIPADPIPPAAPRTPRLLLIAVVLAAVASLFSAIGLLVAARTVSSAAIARDEATHRAEMLGRLGHAVEEVEALARAQKAALARSGGAAPATADDMRRELDLLRRSLGRSQAPGTTALAGVVRQGQAELSGRLDDLESRIDAISQRATREARH